MGTCRECISKDHIVTKACIFSSTQLQLNEMPQMQNTVFLLYLHSGNTYSNKGVCRGQMYRETQLMGSEERRKKCSACVSRRVTVRSGTVQNKACPVKGRAKRQLYKNQGWAFRLANTTTFHELMVLSDCILFIHFHWEQGQNVNLHLAYQDCWKRGLCL